MSIPRRWSAPNFKLGGIAVELQAAMEFDQTYEPVGGSSDLQMADGNVLRQTYWTRLKTTLNGSGIVPHGLGMLDWTVPQTISCAAPLDVASATRTVTLPAGRRSDAAPRAYALVGGVYLATPVAMAGDVATATEVADADAYVFLYHPEFSAYVTRTQSFNRQASKHSWQVTAVELNT